MTKKDAERLTEFRFELVDLANKASDDETKQLYLRWLNKIEPLYIKAQKVLARYYK